MNDLLKATLKSLAEKYEIPSFCNADPSQFLRWYDISKKENIPDVESCSFIAAMLAFGSRKQFIPKIASIMELADNVSGSISKWLISKAYEDTFPTGDKKFYRFYSYNDMHDFFSDLAELLCEGGEGGLGEALRLKFEKAIINYNNNLLAVSPDKKRTRLQDSKPLLADIISISFPHGAIVPKGKSSANKRIHMYLRWMVRQNSPVDLGLWKWYSPSELLIPLDVHVMEEGVNLGVLPKNAKATRKTAIILTESLREIWPDDPCKGDFALFGLGVDK